MARPMTPLQDLADQVTSTQDALLREMNLASGARRQLLQSLQPTKGRVWLRVAWALPAVAALVIVWRLHWPTPTYSVGNSKSSVPVGAWLAAPADAELPVHFSDQSSVTLSRSSHARVVELRDRDVRLLLERGRVSVSVRHQEHRSWHLRAGPFDVAVTGTRFEVSWHPDREEFEVHTTEGKVVVTGDQFSPHGVAAGETLHAERMDGVFKFVETNVPQAHSLTFSAPTEGLPEVSVTAAVASSAAPHTSSPIRTAATQLGPSWRELAGAGQYRAAMDQAEKEGFEGLCQSLSLSDLLALSEAARFAGHADRARLALTSIRQRFHGNPAASVATFTLGRIAFDSARDYLGAARWFRAYLSEQPTGSLAREAAGRLMESLQRGGDHAGALVAARQYLELYPDGPQKNLAHQVLGE